MTAYLTKDEFKARTLMPPEYVDALELVQAGWVLAQLEQYSRWIDSRLRKRYAAPFDVATCPEIVKSWLTRIVTVRCFLRRGIDPTDPQFETVRQDALDATVEIKEAADCVEGLFDLPLKDSEKTTGITQGAPLGYAEAGPYEWVDAQREAIRNG